MINCHRQGLPYFTYESLNNYPDLIHFTTTRHGGFSQGDYGALNVSFAVGEEPSLVARNRYQLTNIFGIDPEKLLFGQQIHESDIAIIKEEFFNRKLQKQQQQLKGVDGLITNLKEVCICVLSADCGGILLFDPQKKVIAAIHAGWRGTVKKIVMKAIHLMQQDFDSQPKEIIAVISPCIGVDSYEVGETVAAQFEAIFGANETIINRTYAEAHVNVSEANRRLLIESGLLPQNITTSETCTFENNDQFYSARRGDMGRFCSGIMIK